MPAKKEAAEPEKEQAAKKATADPRAFRPPQSDDVAVEVAPAQEPGKAADPQTLQTPVPVEEGKPSPPPSKVERKKKRNPATFRLPEKKN
jgi:hypothetical protein